MVKIDPELRDWIIPLKPEEYSELEKSIMADGCRDPLVVWNGVIADGHHRFKICTEHNIPYNTVEKSFENKDEVKLWMVRNQIARRNLESIQRIALVMKGEDLIAARAKEHERLSQGQGIKGSVNLPNLKPIDTRKESATLAKVSERTYDKGKEVLKKATPEIIAKVISGDVSIHKAYTDIKHEEKREGRREELAQKIIAAKALPENITLYHGNFLKDYTKISKGSIDCIITDPPYVKEWLDNYEDFAIAADHVLKPGGFLVTYVGQIHLDSVLAQMTKHLDYFWIMMLKHSGNIQAVHVRSVQCGMKPILIFNKPPRTHPKRYFNDVIMGSGREKDSHEWQQGEEELRQIFEPFTDPGDTILDPFMGSGTTIAMAKKLNRVAIGFDINQENIDIVKGRLSEE